MNRRDKIAVAHKLLKIAKQLTASDDSANDRPLKVTKAQRKALKDFATPLGFYCYEGDETYYVIFENSNRPANKQMTRDEVREKLINRKLMTKFPELAFFNKGASEDARKDYMFAVYTRANPNVVYDAEIT